MRKKAKRSAKARVKKSVSETLRTLDQSMENLHQAEHILLDNGCLLLLGMVAAARNTLFQVKKIIRQED